MSAAPIDRILAQLHKVRQRQPHQWSACCPAHDDKGPSLSLRETPEGSVLLHCFAGCAVSEVVAALGMDLSDLFPPQKLSGREPKRTPLLLTAGQALELLDREAHLVTVAAANLLHGVELTQDDLSRISKASGRITWLRNECTGGSYA
jgi:hypothetical protein